MKVILIITDAQLKAALNGMKDTEALIIRTTPNPLSKTKLQLF